MKKIYIIHGWTYTTDAWKPILGMLRHDFESVMLHVPGLTSASSEIWTLDGYVEWLAHELPDDSPVTLIGHSNGGRIAIAFAAKYPERVSQLILIDAAGIVHHEFLLELKRVVFRTVARIGKHITSAPFIRKVLYRMAGVRDYERAPKNMRATIKNLIERDLTPELSQINAPTLIIWGQRDTATPVSDAHIMHEKIHGSKMEIIPDAAHSPHATHPEEMTKIISEFVLK